MATDKNAFDDWLKANLWRDLIFRATFWVLIASVGAYYTLAVDAQATNEYLKSQTNSVFRAANIIGTIAIFLGLVAMMFKDLEPLSPTCWGRDSRLGRVGGFFRRLAGDLTLWTLGALVSTLFVVGLVGFRASGTWREWALFSFLYLILVGSSFVVALLNIYVRRGVPLLAEKIKSPGWVFWIYGIAIFFCPIYVVCMS